MPADRRTYWLYFGRKDEAQHQAFRELSRLTPRTRQDTLMRWLLRGRAAELRKRRQKQSRTQGKRSSPPFLSRDEIPVDFSQAMQGFSPNAPHMTQGQDDSNSGL